MLETPGNTAYGVLPNMPEFVVKRNPSADYMDSVVLPLGLTHEQCQTVLREVVIRHDVLRLHLEIQNGNRVFSTLSPDTPFKLERWDLSKELCAQGPVAVLRKADDVKAEFERSLGTFSKFTYVELNSLAPNRLLVLLDHIIYDEYAIQLMTEDITLGVQQVMSGQMVQLDPPSASYRDWAFRAHAYLDSEEALPHLRYWTERPWSDVYQIPGRERGYVDGSYHRSTTATLDPESTDRLFGWARKGRIPIWHVFLALLDAAVRATFDVGGRPLTLTTLVNQRTSTFDDIDLSSTMAVLRSAADFVIEPGESAELPDVIKSIQAGIEGAPLSGTTYELLYMRFKDRIKRVRSGISFNYLGATQVAQCGEDGEPVYNEVVSKSATERSFADDDMNWMMRWPEYRLDSLEPGRVYLVRLHFFEPLADGPGSRYFDIWLNGKMAAEKYDIFERAGGKYKLVIEEFACNADDAGCIQINFVSYLDSIANAGINAIEVLEPVSQDALAIPADLDLFRPVIRINAGGAAIGDFAADDFDTGYTARDTDRNPVDLGACKSPAPPAVYETDCYCRMINGARHWPTLAVKCQRTRVGLKVWIDTCDCMYDGAAMVALARNFLAQLAAAAAM